MSNKSRKFNPEASKLFERQADEPQMVLLYLKNADCWKYGSIFYGLARQLFLGQDQYPRNLIDAHIVLSNHWFDAAYGENEKK